MTIGEIIALDKKLGHKATHEEQRAEETRQRMEIKTFINKYMYSDVDPFEVVKTISKITVEVREMDTVQTSSPKAFTAGGFVGHFADNRSGQEYTYNSNEENAIIRLRWSRPRRAWCDKHGNRYLMADKPYEFYDYNF